MTIEEAKEILIHHNAWRRDNHVPPKYEMVNPTELGKAIDIAIEVLSEHSSEKSCTDENYANYSAQLNLPF